MDAPPAPPVCSAAGPGQRPLRVVLDTNVLLSLYVFADSRFAVLRQRIDSGAWQVVSRADCLAEFRRVLAYPAFALDCAAQEAAYAAYAASVTLDSGPPSCCVALPRCTDRDDQKFLEAARDHAADWLVTADKALLRLGRHSRLKGMFRILTPAAALLA